MRVTGMTKDFTSIYKEKYEHPRWQVVYGEYSGINKFALSETVSALQAFLPYVVEVNSCNDINCENTQDHLLVIGETDSNKLLRELSEKNLLAVPDHPEGYSIRIGQQPWNNALKVIAICGASPAGTLYGVEHFNTEIIGHEAVRDLPEDKLNVLAELPERTISEQPVIQQRGIWTWGYPVYDYRNFIDNMARLRMNTMIIWNDIPPVDFPDLIEYANSRAINVIPGFHWGWGRKLDLSCPENIAAIKNHVLDDFNRNYADLDINAIYFQTLTETPETKVGSHSIAKLSCNLVNEIGNDLLKIRPDIKIYFGLHAVSILDDYSSFESLDKRISIVWEDAGVIPYCIDPVTNLKDTHRGWRPPMDDLPKTIDYSKKLAALRNRQEFMMVAKGFPNISWSDFENHKKFLLAGQTPYRINEKLHSRKALWNRVNSRWIKNYPAALRFFNEILAEKPRETMVTALIEDGMFEAGIMDGPAIFGAMLWNPSHDADYYMRFISNDYYSKMKIIN
jgi:hypothetical protein